MLHSLASGLYNCFSYQKKKSLCVLSWFLSFYLSFLALVLYLDPNLYHSVTVSLCQTPAAPHTSFLQNFSKERILSRMSNY